jgi:hypothetical protein
MPSGRRSNLVAGSPHLQIATPRFHRGLAMTMILAWNFGAQQ